MSQPADPALPPPPWEPLLAGFRKHELTGKGFIVIHSSLAAFLLFAVLMTSLAVRDIVLWTAVAGCEIVLVAGVALHKRAALIAALAISILGAAGCLYAASQALRQPVVLMAYLLILALHSTFVRYFGRLQRVAPDSALASDDRGPPAGDGAA